MSERPSLPSPRPDAGPGAGAEDLATLLAGAEAHLAEAARIPAARAPSPEWSAAMTALEAGIAACPEAARPLAARLDRVRAAYALRVRTLPDAVLEGLYDDIRGTLRAEGGWLRTGMSEAFLDAPRTLVVWRRVAVAACLLLALSAGYQLRGASDAGPEGQELRTLGVLGTELPELPAGRWTPLRTERVPARSGARALPAALHTDEQVGAPRAARRGVYVFPPASGLPQDASRMLDRIQIFPVPGREIDVGEDN